MVRFHLVGLIAVGLMIQFTSALSRDNLACLHYADKLNHGCEQLGPQVVGQLPIIPDVSLSKIEYLSNCFCKNEDWYRRYNICLKKLLLHDPRGLHDDRSTRCRLCSDYYGKHAGGIAGCNPKGI